MVYVFLLIGFVALIKGADYFVDGASSVASIFKVSPLIIGLTVVAFGTSAPELAVSVTSAFKGQNEICLGNVIGSNIFNLLVVTGVSAMICPLKVKKTLLSKEFICTLLAMVFLLVLSLDTFINIGDVLSGSARSLISKSDGIMLLIFFGVFMIELIMSAIESKKMSEEEIGVMPFSKSIVCVMAGAVGVILGGDIVVNSSVMIAAQLGLDERIIGLTIIAVGTSLPELVASVTAAKKGYSDMAIGNVLGSTIFNIVLILGVSTTINPILVDRTVVIDMLIMIGAGVLTYIFAKTALTVKRLEGTVLVICYILYMFYIVLR